jgi:NAD(P)-dependent dehydrogenase (short-subunit alcohol dehydrogenase family)
VFSRTRARSHTYVRWRSGIAAVGNVEKATEEEMDRVFAVNVKGVFHIAQEGVKAMLSDGKGGVILNLASIGKFPRNQSVCMIPGTCLSCRRLPCLLQPPSSASRIASSTA